MFLLGHSCWSYLFAKFTGRRIKVEVPAYLAFLSGVLPDFDIYVHNLYPPFLHHTYTHSLLVLLPVALVLVYFFGRLGIAFSVGILSHLVGDFLVGTIPILYPISPDWTVGLDLGIPSLADTLLEGGAFLLVILAALWNGDYKLVLKPSRQGLLLAIPLVSIVTLTLLFAGDKNLPLATFAFSRRALTIITVGHVLLSGMLGLGVIQGLRWYLQNRRTRTSNSRPQSPNSHNPISFVPDTHRPFRWAHSAHIRRRFKMFRTGCRFSNFR
jgi:LexA-binding, inner membrane-associated putative hydrolase